MTLTEVSILRPLVITDSAGSGSGTALLDGYAEIAKIIICRIAVSVQQSRQRRIGLMAMGKFVQRRRLPRIICQTFNFDRFSVIETTVVVPC